MEIYTIGFTKKSAEQFFETLKKNKIKRLIDVRLRNSSQLAGFTKTPDLQYFLMKLCKIEYYYEPLLAPGSEMLDELKKKKGDWRVFEELFLNLMNERKIEQAIKPALFAKRSVLLCSEAAADHCHRRLILDYLQSCWGVITAIHL